MQAADQLRDLAPEAGHLLHMPSHIDVLCGQYYNAVVANRRAIAVDQVFAARDGVLTDYTFYRAHNIHFKVYAAMMLGQFKTALEAADEIADLANEDLLRIDESAHGRSPGRYLVDAAACLDSIRQLARDTVGAGPRSIKISIAIRLQCAITRGRSLWRRCRNMKQPPSEAAAFEVATSQGAGYALHLQQQLH